MAPEERDDEDGETRVRSREARVLRVRREAGAVAAENGDPRSRLYTVLGFAEADAAPDEPEVARLLPVSEPVHPETVRTSLEAPAAPPAPPSARSPFLPAPSSTTDASPDPPPADPVADPAGREVASEPHTVSLKLMAAHAARVESRQRRAARQSRTQRAGTGAAVALVLAGVVTFSALSSIDEGSAFDITPAASSITQGFGFGTLEAQRAADKRDAGEARERRAQRRTPAKRRASPAKGPDAQPPAASPPPRETPDRDAGPAREERRRPASSPQAQAPRPQPQQSPRPQQRPQPQQKATPKPAPIKPARPAPSGGGDPSLGSGPGL